MKWNIVSIAASFMDLLYFINRNKPFLLIYYREEHEEKAE